MLFLTHILAVRFGRDTGKDAEPGGPRSFSSPSSSQRPGVNSPTLPSVSKKLTPGLLLLFVILANILVPGQSALGVGRLPSLLDAIEQVESGGDPNAVGDNGLAIGAYQIHPIVIKDANRILDEKKYNLKDRWDNNKSRDICRIIITYYEDTFEGMARRWNGGTNWHNKPATKKYWNKVKECMEGGSSTE